MSTPTPVDNPTALVPDSAPFDSEQRAWLNGYLAGLLSADRLVVPGTPVTDSAPKITVTLLYGSQTGTVEALAHKFAKSGKSKGAQFKVVAMDQFATLNLAAESHVALVTSTYGDGDFPDNAQPFWDFLSAASPALSHLRFAVLALGDTNYPHFCKAGRLFDEKLEALGAKRLIPRIDCDVDYEEKATRWLDDLIKELGGAAAASVNVEPVEKKQEGYSKSNPFPARLKTNRPLNGPGSAKDTRHIEIALLESGLTYEVGDALGVMPKNCPEFVQEILDAAGLDGEEAVKSPSGSERPLRLTLQEDCDLKPFLTELPAKSTATDLIAKLRKLQPRLYSISSSQKAHPNEVHLTIGVVRYELNSRKLKGVCSTFMAERVSSEQAVPIFVHRSPGFKPPLNNDAPMIMIGPGTGIAPFRAFLEERMALGAKGKNWLFFGDQKSSADFLYQDELEAWLKSGHLTRLDTAFSRDQAEKVYVQNRMTENAELFWSWLQDGGHIYVCGDASRMAKDVDAALHELCQSAGGLSADGAAEYVQTLKTQKRYARDVY